MDVFLQAVHAGGDIALVAIAAAIYRLDARLIRVETKLQMHLSEKEKEA